jgi:hypothetical protein
MLISGLIAAQGLLLIYAGAAKLRRGEAISASLAALRLRHPAWRVLVAGGELAIGVAALTLRSGVSGPLLAGTFGSFALVTIILLRAGELESCGCLGDDGTGPTYAHAALDTVLAVVALAAALTSSPGTLALAASRPGAGLAAFGLALPLSIVLLRSLRGVSRRPIATLPERLVTGSALLLERRLSRRSALIRIAVAGSALAVAPLRYLLYPGTALAVVVPGDCSSGGCTDGYTAFCCTITGGLNSCPSGTFPGGWWKCTDYRGRQLCREAGVRYYVDCNRLPSQAWPGGCQCAGGDCANRRVACNVFRYGQCNPQIGGVTEVVCRMVVCTNPGQIAGLNCSSSVAVDDAVCGHEAPCLEPPALELVPAGGA